jgi:hypothetical protein
MSVLKYRDATGAGAIASTTVRFGKTWVIVNPPRCSEVMTCPYSAVDLRFGQRFEFGIVMIFHHDRDADADR